MKLWQKKLKFYVEKSRSIKVINYILSFRQTDNKKRKNQLNKKKLLKQWKSNIICSIL